MHQKQSVRRPRMVRQTPHLGRGSTLLGVFIGLLLGLALAAAVALYLGRSGFTTPMSAVGGAKDSGRNAKHEVAVPVVAADKPRFDFYKILPGGEEPKLGADRKTTEKLLERPADKPLAGSAAKAADIHPVKSSDQFWLQAGAFTSESEAENLKARLALSGWEAAIQTATTPDKGVRYRVRIGPYDNTDELNRMKSELGNRGFDVAVIKNQ